MYLVKALVAANFPVEFNGPNVPWAANELRKVDDNWVEKCRAHTNVFSVVAGPDEGAIAQAMLDDVGTDAAGAKNGSTVTADENQPVVHQTVLTLAATPITMADASAGGGVKIYDMPEGNILILGASGSIAMTTTSTLASTLNAGVTCNWGVGTVVQANGTLATTEQNIIPTTNITASATINVAGAASASRSADVVTLNGSGTPIDVYLNIGAATGTDIDADATVTVAGTITLTWVNLGDT